MLCVEPGVVRFSCRRLKRVVVTRPDQWLRRFAVGVGGTGVSVGGGGTGVAVGGGGGVSVGGGGTGVAVGGTGVSVG